MSLQREQGQAQTTQRVLRLLPYGQPKVATTLALLLPAPLKPRAISLQVAVKFLGNGASNGSIVQRPKLSQTETPALPAERYARAAWLPEEAGLPRQTMSPARQCALLSVPFRHAQPKDCKTQSALRGPHTFFSRMRTLKL